MSNEMRAVGYRHSGPIDDPESLIDVTLPVPEPGPRDLQVQVRAVSVNPVDTKVRTGNDPGGEVKVLGYDAAGVVTAVGAQVSRFGVGDEVYYAGSITRPGTNAEYHLVHENIVGRKPSTLDFPAAAALPLTAITAWETLFERFAAAKDTTGTLLVLGAAGGVGSVLVQLAKRLTRLTVIATASRDETVRWVTELGADHVVNHHGDLAAAVREVAPDGVDYLFTPFSAGNVETFAEVLRPGGHITAIDDPAGLDTAPLKPKSIAWHWELMFTKPMFLPDDASQHDLLNEVARLVDDGTLRSTLTSTLEPINAAQLRAAHRIVASGGAIGKIVLTGWPR